MKTRARAKKYIYTAKLSVRKGKNISLAHLIKSHYYTKKSKYKSEFRTGKLHQNVKYV